MKFKKYIFISLLLIFIFNISICQAADIIYKPEVTFPGFETATTVTPLLLGNYISALYQYLLYVAGVLAVIVIMVGGFQWIVAGGNQSKIGEAKERIMSAIIGLFLALGSYLLLFTINPELIKIHDLNMPSISPITLYCQGGQSVIPSSPIDADKAERMNISSQISNQFTGVDGAEAFCGFKYEYYVEEKEYSCEGIKCLESNKTCVRGECLLSAPAGSCANPNNVCELEGGGQGYCTGGFRCIPCLAEGLECSITPQCCIPEDGSIYCWGSFSGQGTNTCQTEEGYQYR